MKESQFIEIHQLEWDDFDNYINYYHSDIKINQKSKDKPKVKKINKSEKQLEKKSKNIDNSKKNKKLPKLTHENFPAQYRRLCEHLSIAKTRQFSLITIDKLHELVKKGHNVLHKEYNLLGWSSFYELFFSFPRAFRREKKVMIIAFLLFIIPALSVFLLINHTPDLIYSFMSPDQVDRFEQMYYPYGKTSANRTSDSDVMMFGVYIYNNIGIGLRSFASGLILCIGAIFVDVFNGLYLGAVFGHLQNLGYASQTLYPFVITHGSFELTAIMISSGAGIRLGLSALFPKRLARIDSLKKTTKDLMPIVIGFVLMLVIAAFIEAFFSSLTIPAIFKYSIGSICWVLVYYYLLFVGRSRDL